MKTASTDRLENEKRKVPSKFDEVASSYDFLTSLNPGYRKHLTWSARRLGLGPESKILDLCCGTGISTEALVDVYPTAQVIGLDASKGMIELARCKKTLQGVHFVCGDAMNPQESGLIGPFDGILMAYGIRNMPDRDRCLKNLLSLLRPGGVVCFHEYSVADSFAALALWNAVALGIIIPTGLLVARDSSIYRYLRRSVVEFDGVTKFEERLRSQGYVGVHTEQMDGWQRNIVHSFLGKRAEDMR